MNQLDILADSIIVFLLTMKDAILNFVTRGWWGKHEGNKRIADEFRR